MSKTVKYIGTQMRWPELAATGKQSVWMPGQCEQRSDSEAAALLATGQFFDQDAVNQTPEESAAVQALVSGGGIAPLKIAAPDGTDAGDVISATLATGWTVTGYQWTLDGADIVGATSSTYTVQAGDSGKTLGCRAAGALYTATIAAAVPATPPGAIALDALPITLDALSITLA